ncbi:MAG TPA: hypothetical protein VIX37_00680 [Candidatus Sulfotelmatobacter sp.]
MGFGFRRWGLQLVVLLWGTMAMAGTGDRDLPKITVLVNNNAGVSRTVLRKAELDAGQIFHAAGVEIEWEDCSTDVAVDVCRQVHGANQLVFVLHIVPTGKTSTDSVFGVAFLGEGGMGRYCNVFFDRVEETQREAGIDVAHLLGAVAAHELGHLLLGSHGHSNVGIMTPVWREQSLREIDMGIFFFTREQVVLMRARLSPENFAVTSLR